MALIKMYMKREDAERVNGRTLADLQAQAENTGNFNIIRDFSYFRNLTKTSVYGPAIPPESITFRADFDDIKRDGMEVAVFVGINVTKYRADFSYGNGTVLSLAAYDGKALADSIIDIFSRAGKWSKYFIREKSIELATVIAKMGVGEHTSITLDGTDVWLMTIRPSTFEQVAYSFPAGRGLELVE